MNAVTSKLLEQVNHNHDWRRGTEYSRGGLEKARTDTCRICGLSWFRHWQSGSPPEDTEHVFTLLNGTDVSLLAASVACVEVGEEKEEQKSTVDQEAWELVQDLSQYAIDYTAESNINPAVFNLMVQRARAIVAK